MAVLNESMDELRVYAYAADEEDRTLLGWVGGNELEFFRVPEDARTMGGDYHIAVQQVMPLPQLGVPATAHPLLATPKLSPEPMETVKVIVAENEALSTVSVR